jgi:hypothetical protein
MASVMIHRQLSPFAAKSINGKGYLDRACRINGGMVKAMTYKIKGAFQISSFILTTYIWDRTEVK